MQKYPKTKEEKQVDVIFGTKVEDPFRWLESNDETVLAWIDEQNKYAKSVLDNCSQREKIKDLLGAEYSNDTVYAPRKRGDKLFLRMRTSGEEQDSIYMEENGVKTKLLSPLGIAGDAKAMISGYVASRDGKLILFGISKAGNDKAELRVFDVDKRELLADKISEEYYPHQIFFSANSDGFWYTRHADGVSKNEVKLHERIYFHKIGTNESEDKVFFGDNLDKEDRVGMSLSSCGEYVVINVEKKSAGIELVEMFITKLSDKNRNFVPVYKSDDVKTSAVIHKDYLYIRTDRILKILLSDVLRGGETRKQEIIHPEEGCIEKMIVLSDSIIILKLENAVSVLAVYDLDGVFKKTIPIGEASSVIGISYEVGSNNCYFIVMSYTESSTIYKYDSSAELLSVYLASKRNLKEYDIETRQEWAVSPDGTRIPIFVTCDKNVKLDGNNPMWVYGYGGFGTNIKPEFKKEIIPFLMSGGIYVEACIRGGGEFGKDWHLSGTKEKKMNVFNDFIASIEYLHSRKYSSPSKTAICGWSNGGLLVSYLTITRPELFAVGINIAPVTDMIRFHLYPDSGRLWISEFGSSENEEQFKNLINYSPYHNSKPNSKYPAVMFVVSDKDDRVNPAHTFKMLAKLQADSIGDKPIIMRYEKGAGHGGAIATSLKIEQWADVLAFVFEELGMKYN